MALAYVLAIAIPPLGLIFGIALVLPGGKIHSKHGVLIIALSLIAAVGWILVLASGALNSTNTGY